MIVKLNKNYTIPGIKIGLGQAYRSVEALILSVARRLPKLISGYNYIFHFQIKIEVVASTALLHPY